MATDPLFTVQQAAHRKGVSYHTVLRAIHRGRLPSHRLGHQLFVPQAHLESWQPARDHAPSAYRREPDLDVIPSPLNVESLDRATLEDTVTSMATALIHAAGKMSRSQLQDVSLRLTGIVFDPQVAVLRPIEPPDVQSPESEAAIATEPDHPGAQQANIRSEEGHLAETPREQGASDPASSSHGNWVETAMPTHLEPESPRMEQRAKALSRLRSLQRELERLGSTQEPGSPILVWSGYSDVLNEILDELRQAGEAIEPFETQPQDTMARMDPGEDDPGGISLERLMAGIRHAHGSVARGLETDGGDGCHVEPASCLEARLEDNTAV